MKVMSLVMNITWMKVYYYLLLKVTETLLDDVQKELLQHQQKTPDEAPWQDQKDGNSSHYFLCLIHFKIISQILYQYYLFWK